MSSNPYPNRPYPVGELSYKIEEDRWAKCKDLRRLCMLEFGEQEILFDIPRILNMGGNYLNLGHAMGGSSILMARGLEDQNLTGTVHSIDIFEEYKNHFDRAIATLIDRNARDKVALYRGYTNDFVETFKEIPVTFLFIDADHSYEGVKADFLNYSPFVVPGGALAFHDTKQEPSHNVIAEYLEGNPNWHQTHHVNRIKVFKRL